MAGTAGAFGGHRGFGGCAAEAMATWPIRLHRKGGHVGLRLLADTVADMGGCLAFERSELGGTRLWATFPLALGAESTLSGSRRTR